MSKRLVTHIRRDGADADRRIDMLSGPGWGPLSIDTVISDINAGRHTYFVTAHSFYDAEIEVLRHPTSGRYLLRTKPDGLYDNNLYALPEIPRTR